MKQKCCVLYIISAAAVLFLVSFALAGWDSSTKVFTPGVGQVVLCDNYCSGEPYLVLKTGDYPDLRQYGAPTTSQGNWNDRASCIYVGPQTKIRVYQHINYGGSSKEFFPGLYCLKSDWWDNSASSCRVLPQ